MVVEGWLARAAAARPAHPALITPAGSWSYAQLLAAAEARARPRAGAARRPSARPGRDGGRAAHLGHGLGAARRRADVRQLPLERPRLGSGPGPGPARALAVRAARGACGGPVDHRAL